MYSGIVILLAGALSVSALPQTANVSTTSVNPDYAALDSIIDALNSYAVTTATPTDAVTRTAVGFVSLNSSMPTFTDIAIRATSSAVQTVIIPDLELEITQYINPIQTSPPRKEKRDIAPRGQVPIDICPKPKTITVIEWIDCEATPIDCPVCPTTATCDCEEGWKWIMPTSTDPCTTTTKTCPVCPGGIEYIILATAAPDIYKYKRPCDVCPGGYEYIIADGSDCGMDILYILDTSKNECPADKKPDSAPTKVLAGAGKAVVTGQYAYSGTLVISSQSRLVVSTEFPLSSAWESVLTWDAATASASASGDPVIGISFPRTLLIIVEITGASTATATPTLDAVAMRRRGMRYL
jgi:hypothetical protein